MAKQKVQNDASVLLHTVHFTSSYYSTILGSHSDVICQEAAQNSLELHGRELEPNLPLNVYLSNPERKKERTDQDANEREVYVAGLSRFANKADLEKLFSTVRIYLFISCYWLRSIAVWPCEGYKNGSGRKRTLQGVRFR